MIQAHYENGRYVPPTYIGDKSLATPVSLTTHISNGWKTLNKPRTIFLGASKGVKILILLMLIVTGVLLADQHFKSPDIHGITGGNSPLDPLKPLWGETLSQANLSSLSCAAGDGAASYRANAFFDRGIPGQNLNGAVLTTGNAFGFPLGSTCIDKTPFDLSTAAAKVIDLWQSFGWNNSVSGTFPPAVYFFVTRNSTAPTHLPDYNPLDDPNVALIQYTLINPGGANTASDFVYMQRDPIKSISSDDHGCNNTGGSVYFCSPQGAVTWQISTSQYYASLLQLNYTGSSTTVSPSLLASIGCVSCKIYSLPWFNLQGQKYYWGIGVRGATSACPCNNPIFMPAFDPQVIGNEAVPLLSGGMEIEQYTPPVISPSLEASGFFGPLIRALVSLGVFIFQGVAQFFYVVYSSFITALDVIGNFLGLGAIGSAFAGALKGFADWIINIFGNIFLQSLNFVNFITSGLTLMINGVSNYWAGATAFIGQLVDLLSQGWTFVTSTLKFGNLGIKWLVVVWLLWGILASAKNLQGFMDWFTISMLLTVRLFHGLYWIGDQAFLTVLRAKQMIAQWMILIPFVRPDAILLFTTDEGRFRLGILSAIVVLSMFMHSQHGYETLYKMFQTQKRGGILQRQENERSENSMVQGMYAGRSARSQKGSSRDASRNREAKTSKRPHHDLARIWRQMCMLRLQRSHEDSTLSLRTKQRLSRNRSYERRRPLTWKGVMETRNDNLRMVTQGSEAEGNPTGIQSPMCSLQQFDRTGRDDLRVAQVGSQ